MISVGQTIDYHALVSVSQIRTTGTVYADELYRFHNVTDTKVAFSTSPCLNPMLSAVGCSSSVRSTPP